MSDNKFSLVLVSNLNSAREIVCGPQVYAESNGENQKCGWGLQIYAQSPYAMYSLITHYYGPTNFKFSVKFQSDRLRVLGPYAYNPYACVSSTLILKIESVAYIIIVTSIPAQKCCSQTHWCVLLCVHTLSHWHSSSSSSSRERVTLLFAKQQWQQHWQSHPTPVLV